MKTYCKGVDPSDVISIEPFVYEALMTKLKRKDYSEFVARYCGIGGKEIRRHAHEGLHHYPELDRAIRSICEDIRLRILSRELALDPVRYSTRTDGLSKKTRIIGIESVMQQLMEHVAVGCMQELWDAKYERHQYASIKGRGQLKGAQTIQKWTKAGMTTYFVKLDVRQCFRSLSRETVMRWLRRDIAKNGLLLWFVDALLQMHGDGLIIGSLLSQFLCNYFMSYAYRYVMGLHKERRGKLRQLCSCALFYMDDILICSRDRRDLLMAARKLIRYLKAAFCLEIKPGWNIRRHSDCGIDMMGYVITAKGKIRIRPRVFIRARRAYMHAAAGDLRPKITRRVSAYYGFFKAAGIRRLRWPRPAKGAADQFVSVHAMQFMASMLTSKEDKEVLLCAA